MKVKRKIIDINEKLCDGCGQCVIACAEGAIKIIDGKAKVISDNLCDGLGACIGDCPQGALKIVERETEEFDEDAVEQHLKQQKNSAHTRHIGLRVSFNTNSGIFNRNNVPICQQTGFAYV